MVKRYTNKTFQSDLKKLENFIEKEGGNKKNKKGGDKNEKNEKNVRHFKLIEADKKEVNLGYVKVNPSSSPLSAAKKLFKSLSHHKNMSGKDKLKFSSTFTIQETTQDSKRKIYGPYKASWKKISNKDKDNASRAGIQFNMRSVVKLLSKEGGSKKKKKSVKKRKMKGGSNEDDSDEDDNLSNYGSEDDEYEQIIKSLEKEEKVGG